MAKIVRVGLLETPPRWHATIYTTRRPNKQDRTLKDIEKYQITWYKVYGVVLHNSVHYQSSNQSSLLFCYVCLIT